MNIRILMILAASTMISACATRISLDKIAAAERQWKAAGVADYQFTIVVNRFRRDTDCSTGPRVEAEVRNSSLVKFGSCHGDEEYARSFGTVPALFAAVREMRGQRPAVLQVEFHPQLGYPERIYVNYSRWITDVSAQYEIRDFKVLN